MERAGGEADEHWHPREGEQGDAVPGHAALEHRRVLRAVRFLDQARREKEGRARAETAWPADARTAPETRLTARN